MKEKIEWYREVLALEPHSRLFFPLAALYRAAGDAPNALDTLSKGLAHHPEHLEARLMQAEILEDQGRSAEATAVIQPLLKAVDQFPYFWKTWAEAKAAAAQDQGDTDLALGLRLTLAALNGVRPDWGQALTAALTSALTGQPAPIPAARPVQAPAQASPTAPAPSAPTAPAPEAVVTIPAPSGNKSATDFVILEEGEDDEPAAEVQTGSSVRTRTMADLLTKQGDLTGALEIYEELWRGSAPGDDRRALAEIMDDVRGRIASSFSAKPQAKAEAAPAEPAPAEPASDKSFLSTLEALADRLEHRGEA